MQRTWSAAAGLTLLLVSGCAGGVNGAGSSPASSTLVSDPPVSGSSSAGATATGPDAGSEASSAPAETSASSGAGTLVGYVRRGGIQGLSDELTVHEDGGFVLARAKPAVDRSGHLTESELAELQQLAAAVGPSQPSTGKPSGPGQENDVYSYELSIEGQRISVQDPSSNPALPPLLAALSELVVKYGYP